MTAPMITRLDGPVTFALPRRAVAMIALLSAAILLLIVVSLMSGSYPLSAGGVFATLTGPAPEDMANTVVWEFRLPRALAALMSGALLAMSGGVLQTVTRNPLADPSLVGVSQGAGLAVVAAIVAFPELDANWRPPLAFAGALAVAMLIQWIARGRNERATMRFILTGIGLAAFISALTSAFLTYGEVESAMSALGWLAGSVHAAGWQEVGQLAVALAVLLPILTQAARPLSALRFGTDVATGLGINTGMANTLLVTLAVALAAVAVAVVGPLGFVGLVAPHLALRLARCGTGLHLILTGAVGALLVGSADLFGRAAFAPVQIPAGLVTALLGVPIFVLLIMRNPSKGTA